MGLTGSAEFSSPENWPIAFAEQQPPIPILVLICDLRMCPQAEMVGKQLLVKRMTYTLSLDVSLFKNRKVTIESANY